MMDFLDMDSNKLVISEYYENIMANKYDFNTVYQREKVWSEEKKSFLMDSILKNYPIPPVFLRMKIDPDTGTTKYEVIDGKQRLTTIKDFIEGNVLLPDDFGDDRLGNSKLNGASFSDLVGDLEKYKKQLWRYRIPVIFIETDEKELVKNVFDRLNRNGEPLVPQELRHAKYSETSLYKTIDELSKNSCWNQLFLRILEIDRMEDKEFVSELLFVLLENRIISYTKESLDGLYAKWSEKCIDKEKNAYIKVMGFIKSMNLDYTNLKIGKVSHLYAIWVVSILAYNHNETPKRLATKLTQFYKEYIDDPTGEQTSIYKKSMSSNTKGSASRVKRIEAILDYLKSEGMVYEFDKNRIL